MRNARFLLVVFFAFISAAVVATTANIPVFNWATGGAEWAIVVAILWFIACYIGCGYAALRFIGALRPWIEK